MNGIDTNVYPEPQSLTKWIEDNKEQLKPPVGNKLMLGKGSDYQVMIVGGPNSRSDYHIDEGEEFFLQLQGDMLLKIVDGNRFTDVIIREGQVFLLPGNVPHSPQRFPNSIGLVLERQRAVGELDGLCWFCPKCHETNYLDRFQCSDLGTQLGARIDQYYSSEKLRTCAECGHLDQKPTVKAELEMALSEEFVGETSGKFVDWTQYSMPFSLKEWMDKGNDGGRMMFGEETEFQLRLFGESDRVCEEEFGVEKWFYQLEGSSEIVLHGEKEIRYTLGPQDTYLLPPNIRHSHTPLADCKTITFHKRIVL